MIALASAAPAPAEVTGAAENLRTGWYREQPALTHELLSGGTFGPIFDDHLNGQIYAQPLIADGVLLVATEDDMVYGLNPETGEVKWTREVGTAVSAEDPEIDCEDLSPQIGVTGTPVIDTENDVAYFVDNRYVNGESGAIVWQMRAVEMASGVEAPGFPVEIKGEAENLPGIKFSPPKELQRPALLLMNGIVYAAFGSHCDSPPYQGWLVGVSTTTAKVTATWATAEDGGSIWQSGGGLVSDGPGQILFSTGNGPGDGAKAFPLPGPGEKPPNGRLAESVVRVEVQPNESLEAKDFFSPYDNEYLDEHDLDLGSAAPLALPSEYFGTTKVPDLLVQASKEGSIYLLNREKLGGAAQGPGGTDADVETVGNENYGGEWDSSTLWAGSEAGERYVYIPTVSEGHSAEGGVGHLFSFKYVSKGEQPTLEVTSANEHLAFGSGSPIVTSNGTASGTGVVWITWCKPETFCEHAELRAYDAVPVKGELQQLWSAPIGKANKFSRPYANDGRIYVGNSEGDVIGFGPPDPHKAPSEPAPPSEAPAGQAAAGSLGSTSTRPPAAITAGEPPPSLAHLKISSLLSAIASRRHKTRISFSLSAAGTVEIEILRRALSHHCTKRARSCWMYVPTRVKLKYSGHLAANSVELNLAALPAGHYRLEATPLANTGTRGAGRDFDFSVA